MGGKNVTVRGEASRVLHHCNVQDLCHIVKYFNSVFSPSAKKNVWVYREVVHQ